MAKSSEEKAAQVEAVLELMADGEVESFRDACRKLELHPSHTLDAIEKLGFSVQYARARASMFDYIAQKTVDLADAEPERAGIDGKIDPGWVSCQKMRIETRQWHLSKLSSKKFGAKVEVSGDADAPLVTQILVVGGTKPE